MSIHPSTRLLIKLTTHPTNFGVDPEPLEWFAEDPVKRGPVVATVSHPGMRNAIGAHGGTYSVYRAVALAVQATPVGFKPDFTNTLPPEKIGPYPAWSEPGKICSLDPWGHVPQHVWAERLASGDLDIRPTIAVTKSHLDVLEVKEAIKEGKLTADGKVISADGSLVTTKAAIEPVWHLPSVAKRFGCEETDLRRLLYEQTGGMFPELVTRPDLKAFLPPINGVTIYMIGNVDSISDASKPLVVRLHDESYDSDIFASEASSCRSWLVYGMMECVLAGQQGGAGLIVYSRQEGFALGEVAKFLAGNARDKLGQSGSADDFFAEQKRVAGGHDVRLYELLPDVLHWLGVTRVHKLVTSNETKARVLREADIEVLETVAIPQAFLTTLRSGEGATVEALARKQEAQEASPASDAPSPPAPAPPASASAPSPRSPNLRPTRATAKPKATIAKGSALVVQSTRGKKGVNGRTRHITLTTHPAQYSASPMPVVWGDRDPSVRGAICATLTTPEHRNAIGTHNGPYAVYRAVGVARGQIDFSEALDLSSTEPAVKIGPYEAWYDPEKIVAIDPWGHMAAKEAPHGPASEAARRGVDVQPTIAVSRANLKLIEVEQAVDAGRLKVDGVFLKEGFVVPVVKCAIEPVWWLPGIAKRFNLEESDLRRYLFEHTAGMFPELITRTDVSVFLPPIGGCTAYIMGDPASIPDPDKPLAVRVHDECNGSDVFGSDICTCRPYLIQGIEECVMAAQQGGAGLIVYNRKEGRALGEVTKFMVYNARKRQEGGDSAQNYFKRTEMIAGVQDMRFQELMPDALLWLGVKKIDRFISMSDMKYNALAAVGIEVVTRVDIPEELIPADAKVEIDAKMYAGYFSGNKQVKTWEELNTTVGREQEDHLHVDKLMKTA